MVGHTEGTSRHKPRLRQKSCHTIDLGHLQGLFLGQRRKDGGNPFRHHRLSAARRPADEDIVHPCSRYLNSPLHQPLTPDICKVQLCPLFSLLKFFFYIRYRLFYLCGSGKMIHHFPQGSCPQDLYSLYDGSLRRISLGKHTASAPCFPGFHNHPQDSPDFINSSVQTQLPGKKRFLYRIPWNDAVCGQYRHGYGQVKP